MKTIKYNLFHYYVKLELYEKNMMILNMDVGQKYGKRIEVFI